MDNHYIGKAVRVFETNTRHYDGVIHDVVEDDNGDTVFLVVDDEYGFLNKTRKEQLKEIVITKTLKDLE
jgi:DNA phosphorothioation-dependent restriction protein DptG